MDNIVVWVWSPIGYETYLSLKNIYAGQCDVFMIAARSFHPKGADGFIGSVHHYFEQTPDQVGHCAEQIENVLSKARGRTGSFTLFAPQMGSFWIRTTIESEYCRQVYIYDEGGAAYGEIFRQRCSKLWMRGAVRMETRLQSYLKVNSIELKSIVYLYRKGVKFYEVDHPKLTAFVSLFKSAFPGFGVIQLPVAPLQDIQRSKKFPPAVALLLLPPLGVLGDKVVLANILNDIQHVKKTGAGVNWVVKSHPSNALICIDEIASRFRLLHATDYMDFAEEAGINPYREPAFFPFDYCVTYLNSTRLYIDMLSEIELMPSNDAVDKLTEAV